MIDNATLFHLSTRVLQLSVIRDRDYGFASPNVYTHDQVPIALCSSYTKTVDKKGVAEVYDGTAKSRDLKRFCTLNLYGPLERTEDGSKLPPTHCVFQATSFKTMEEWNQDEVAQYHPGVIVSSPREKAWVDARTHMHGLAMCLGPQQERLAETEDFGVVFEDNLSSHGTDSVGHGLLG